MSKAGIGSWQRVLSFFVEHLQFHGGLFVRGGVRHRVGVATGQNIDRTFGGVHRHVELAVMDAICDHRTHTQPAAAGGQLNQASAFYPAHCCQVRRDLDPGVRRFFFNAWTSIS